MTALHPLSPWERQVAAMDDSFCYPFDAELIGLRVRIEALILFPTVLRYDRHDVHSLKAFWAPNGPDYHAEIERGTLLGLYAAEHGLDDHAAAHDALITYVFEQAKRYLPNRDGDDDS